MIAGLLVWVGAVLLHTLAGIPMGLMPARLMIIGMVIALVAFPVAAVVGAWPYKEAEGTAPAL